MKPAAVLIALAMAFLAAGAAAQVSDGPGPRPRTDDAPTPSPTPESEEDDGEASDPNGTDPSPAPEGPLVAFPQETLPVLPDGTGLTALRVENRLERPLRVLLAVREVPADWQAALESNRLELGAGELGEVRLWVRPGAAAAAEGQVLVRFESAAGDGFAGLVVQLSEEADDACAAHPGSAYCRGAPPPRPERSDFARCLRAAPGTEAERLAACCVRLRGDDEAQRRCPVVMPPASGEHITFVAMEDELGIEAYTVDGRLALERLRVALYVDAFEDAEAEAPLPLRDGARMGWRYGEGSQLLLHDTPTGLLTARIEGTVELRFPPGTSFEPTGAAWRVQGDGWEGLVTAPNATLQDRNLTATGSLVFHLAPPMPAAAQAPEMQAKVERAVERRQVGAQVVLPPPPHASAAAADATVYTYDDVRVNVTLPPRAATPLVPIRVEFSADLQEGRTVVLDLDPALVEGGRLELRYYDVVYDNGTRHEAEVVFLEASGLEDVLDATDDGIQPEYWVVRDDEGLHILVSIPQWSTHAVTVASVADVVLQPSVLVGIVSGAGGALLAGLLLLWPRRREQGI